MENNVYNLPKSLSDYLEQLKNAEKFKEFISKCWLILPDDFPNLLENYQDIFAEFAQRLSSVISADPHMLPITPEEIITSFLERQSYLIN